MKTKTTNRHRSQIRPLAEIPTAPVSPDVEPSPDTQRTQEELRLEAAQARRQDWQRWGPYLSERQWGTVREDYSEQGNCWDYFSHDQARSRAYRWGEDGLLGWTDRQCRLCFSLALWNGRDPILKERLFGLTGPEGNHGEDVKECYFYLDATPTNSYCRALYKYPQAEFPYSRLVDENRRRGKTDPEFELTDTGIFDERRYFDVQIEYAKGNDQDTLIRVTISNRGPDSASLDVLPQLWFRNTWSWGCTHEGCEVKPRLSLGPEVRSTESRVDAWHPSLGSFQWIVQHPEGAPPPDLLFTENESNLQRLFGVENASPYVKDAFHRYLIEGQREAVNPRQTGTKCAAWLRLQVPAGESRQIQLRLVSADQLPTAVFGTDFEDIFRQRQREADEFYDRAVFAKRKRSEAERQVARQAYAGLLWSKQFYHLVVKNWLEGDPAQPEPPGSRRHGRNRDWPHLFNRDLISMPDKWEYPWYAAWDLAFHMIPMARLDPEFAKRQLELLLREWYMHPNGQMPAYEFAFSDVNPPVHAWSCWRVYKISGQRGARDKAFLARVFSKLLINFTWWVNRKDVNGNHLFSGGFLGLDNIGLFDRSQPLPGGGHLEQADGTAWMAFYCGTMLSMALELAQSDPSYEDIASKFFEHFVHIADAMNTVGGSGLWNDQDGFYYDQIRSGAQVLPLRVRSLVGVIPLFAVEVLEQATIDRLPGFRKRLEWFLKNRPDLARQISYCQCRAPAAAPRTEPAATEVPAQATEAHGHEHRLLAIPSRQRLERVLRYVLDQNEFLSNYGVRALSRHHLDSPFQLEIQGQVHTVEYVPGESNSGLFGGNSNWRGPIWFPLNFLLIEALERYHHFYGDAMKVECPVGSGQFQTLGQIAEELSRRLTQLFLPNPSGQRACHGDNLHFSQDPHWRDLLLFHEYFHGDNGRGVGASHQTGWTALVTEFL